MICGAHGGHETAEVRDVQRPGGGRGLREGGGGGGGGGSRWGIFWTTSELLVSISIGG